VFYIPANTV